MQIPHVDWLFDVDVLLTLRRLWALWPQMNKDDYIDFSLVHLTYIVDTLAKPHFQSYSLDIDSGWKLEFRFQM